jgi:segregation and condensation protein A
MTLPQEQFRVSNEAFDGPLDLLLYLVRRAEVDIHEIPIAQIADEYLAVLQQDSPVDVEMAGEFLVMAATLIEIKSRSLVPKEQLAEDDATEEGEHDLQDSRGDLIRQLLVFQRIRYASEALDERRTAFGQRYNVSLTIPDLISEDSEPSIELEDVHILDLSDAYEHIASAIDFSRLGELHVAFDDIPIELCQEDMLDRLSRTEDGKLSLQSTFDGLSMSERVGMFLAALELVRIRRVTVHQDMGAGDIIIQLLDDDVIADESSDESMQPL